MHETERMERRLCFYARHACHGIRSAHPSARGLGELLTETHLQSWPQEGAPRLSNVDSAKACTAYNRGNAKEEAQRRGGPTRRTSSRTGLCRPWQT